MIILRVEVVDLFYPPSCDRPQPIPVFPYFMNYLYQSGPLQFDGLVFFWRSLNGYVGVLQEFSRPLQIRQVPKKLCVQGGFLWPEDLSFLDQGITVLQYVLCCHWSISTSLTEIRGNKMDFSQMSIHSVMAGSLFRNDDLILSTQLAIWI